MAMKCTVKTLKLFLTALQNDAREHDVISHGHGQGLVNFRFKDKKGERKVTVEETLWLKFVSRLRWGVNICYFERVSHTTDAVFPSSTQVCSDVIKGQSRT